jgi:hypothetical protein
MAWNCSLANGGIKTSRVGGAARAGHAARPEERATDVGDVDDPDPAGAVADRQLPQTPVHHARQAASGSALHDCVSSAIGRGGAAG